MYTTANDINRNSYTEYKLLTKLKIIITGGAGFIGSHVVKRLVNVYPSYQIINIDKLTYAGNLTNLSGIAHKKNYTFCKGDIVDANWVDLFFKKHKPDKVIHLAAESHVDRSITNPLEFVNTNVIGTVNLLNASVKYGIQLFYHISTDEVFGSLGEEGLFTEETPYDPKSPYSASKAASDHFVRSYGNTHKLPFLISNCSNNYGPNQFPEKLIPLMINNIKLSKELPVYGKGENIRDWLFVEDHADAIDNILHNGKNGETYNIGGQQEIKNIDLVLKLCDFMDEFLSRKKGTSKQLIKFVEDRKGHDLRYAIDINKIKSELGWTPSKTLDVGLRETVAWYLKNTEWLDSVTSGAYMKYYEEQYNQ